MNVLILTEDSETQCPIYDKWKNRYRSGTKVENNLKILKPLFDNNLSIPKDDLENENIYLDVLSEFILQAKYMFQGSFSTIRKLEENISKYANVETLIISSRYGLIDSQKKIIPYQTTIKNKTQLLINDEKLLISDNISKKIKDFSHLIIVLPNYYLEYLLSKKFYRIVIMI
ncbi:MAG: hypothetical protein GX638_05775 [Crenarchaeota archaeon]|nr:hypothetical protein [Thermoproteota archaeon]